MEKLVAKDFWIGKRVLVTGHTGFKGTWLCHMLHHLGAQVYGYALPPEKEPNLFDLLNTREILNRHTLGDIRDIEELFSCFNQNRPEIVFHLAAQPLVGESYEKPVETYQANVMGTLNCLEAIRATSSVKAAIMVTTDKVYESRECVWGYRENEHLGGHDPYSSSKACCEILISSYRRSYFANEDSPRIASVRAGNVIGGGDFSRDRIIPDIYRSVVNRKPIEIRYPNAIRPWQHVYEPLHAYLSICSVLWNASANHVANTAWNIGPNEVDIVSVRKLADSFIDCFGVAVPDRSIAPQNMRHETGILKLDSSKIRSFLGWEPIWDFAKAVERTAHWYRTFIENPNKIWAHSIADLKDYLVQRLAV